MFSGIVKRKRSPSESFASFYTPPDKRLRDAGMPFASWGQGERLLSPFPDRLDASPAMCRLVRRKCEDLSVGEPVLKNSEDAYYTLSRLNEHLKDESQHFSPGEFALRVPTKYKFFVVALANSEGGLTVQGSEELRRAHCRPRGPVSTGYVLVRTTKEAEGANKYYVQYKLQPSSDDVGPGGVVACGAIQPTESRGNPSTPMMRVNFTQNHLFY